MSSEDRAQFLDDDREFTQTLAEVERSLVEVKERYAQIRRDLARKEELLAQKGELTQLQADNPTKEPVKTELRYIQNELDELAYKLECRLFDWSPFWQLVRFGGLGVVVGWLLKTWAG